MQFSNQLFRGHVRIGLLWASQDGLNTKQDKGRDWPIFHIILAEATLVDCFQHF